MGISTDYTFTNRSESTTVAVKPISLGLTTNYGLIEDEPTRCVLNNRTAEVDCGERISYSATNLKNIATDQDVLYPAKVQAGVQCQIRIESMLSTTATEDPTFRVDQPVVGMLTLRIPKSSYVDDADITEMLQRLLGAAYKADGTTRFQDLLRSALRPTED